MHICFLDIDGTMVSTAGAGQAAFATTFAKDFGIMHATPDGVEFAGRSDRAIALDMFALYGLEASPETMQRFTVAYLGRLEEALRAHDGNVLPGVVNLMEQLGARDDVAVGLLTGNFREGAKRKLSHYGLWNGFPFGGYGDKHADRNDIAAAALAAAKAHLNGSATGQVVVVGDTPNDITCARSIGARCVAVPTGPIAADVLRGHEPDLLVDTLEDVEPILQLFA